MSCKVARLGSATPASTGNGPAAETCQTRPDTMSGIPIKRLYTLDDIALEALKQLGEPGEFPYLRGMHRTCTAAALDHAPVRRMGNARNTNERFKYLLEHGQTGLSTAFDLPDAHGRDSDDALSLGEVGKCGWPSAPLEDIESPVRRDQPGRGQHEA